MKYTVKEIKGIIGGGEKSVLVSPDTEVTDLLTDSRSLLRPEGTLFFAIETERDNGHRFIGELYERGVRMFVVGEEFAEAALYPDANFIAVADTAAALRTLGSEHRRRFNVPVVGITGSTGKTMVKEWLYQLLKERRQVARSPRSFNSRIGVPLSLWQLDDATEVALIEAGISREGEMAPLQEMIRPTVAVITAIGSAHDEGFPSREVKIAEKLKLAAGAEVLVAPLAAPGMRQAIEEARKEGRLPADLRVIDTSLIHNELDSDDYPALTEPWHLDNLATCVAVGTALGIPEIISGTRALRPMATRINVSDGVNHCLLVTDSYTCDLHSLGPALDFVARRGTADRSVTLVLSDIDRETESEQDAYASAAALCRLRGVKRVVGIGKEISAHATLFPEGSMFFHDTDSALEQLGTTDFDHELILFKGQAGAGLDRLVHKLEARTHETVLEVNLDAMTSNYNFYRSRLKPTTGIVAMVKASGYGAGSYELAKTLQSLGAAYLAVAVTDEGIDLRKAGITMPIMVLNPKILNYRLLFANRLEPEIFDLAILSEIIEAARKLGVKDYPVHIKLDTGMHRLGFLEEDIPALVDIVKRQDNIRVSSVFSHLATADCPDMNDYTEMQLQTFTRWSAEIADALPYPVKRHILNTAGIIRYPQYQFDMVRLGIGLYGVPVLNDGSEAGLRQVSTLRTVIIAIKEWEAGTTVGYGRRGLLERTSLIATIPVGYADGINRHMGRGRVSFLVNGVKCPTVGNICMDICMIDVTDVPSVKVGDSVEIFGEANPVGPLAEALDTIPYELLTAVSPRVRRLYYTE